MKILLASTLAGALSIAMGATAFAASPQIPTPVNPFPINPVATDGSPLPSQSSAALAGGVYTGRSAAVAAPFNFVGDVTNTGLGLAGNAVGTGLGVADGVVGAGYYGAR